jgi:hypothetical protein
VCLDLADCQPLRWLDNEQLLDQIRDTAVEAGRDGVTTFLDLMRNNADRLTAEWLHSL